MSGRKPRRADGSLRPAVRRYRAKRDAREREAWLANFKPGARERFFKLSCAAQEGEAVWLRPFARELGIPERGCETCHGDGVIQVAGYSVNPGSGVLAPDPQETRDEKCPDCAGTGGESAARLLEQIANERRWMKLRTVDGTVVGIAPPKPTGVPGRCPRCTSPAPHLHPAVQHEGEVQPCPHPYHLIETTQNTPARIEAGLALRDRVLAADVAEHRSMTLEEAADAVDAVRRGS